MQGKDRRKASDKPIGMSEERFQEPN